MGNKQISKRRARTRNQRIKYERSIGRKRQLTEEDAENHEEETSCSNNVMKRQRKHSRDEENPEKETSFANNIMVEVHLTKERLPLELMEKDEISDNELDAVRTQVNDLTEATEIQDTEELQISFEKETEIAEKVVGRRIIAVE